MNYFSIFNRKKCFKNNFVRTLLNENIFPRFVESDPYPYER